MGKWMNTRDALAECSKDQTCIGVENDCTGLKSLAHCYFNTVKKDPKTLKVPRNFQFDERLCVHKKGVKFLHILYIIFYKLI